MITNRFSFFLEAIISEKVKEINGEFVDEVVLCSSSLLFLVKELELIHSTLQTQIKVNNDNDNDNDNPDKGKEKENPATSTTPQLNNITAISALFSIFGDVTSVISFPVRNDLILGHLLEISIFVLGLAVKAEPPVNETKQPKKSQKEKGKSLFFGIKAATTRIIANLAYKNENAQDMVRELGGLQLVMSQCGIDDNNPYGREWGILALRNLTEGNEKNQSFIKEMNPIKVAQNEELEQLGLQAELHDGKVTVKSAGNM